MPEERVVVLVLSLVVLLGLVLRLESLGGEVLALEILVRLRSKRLVRELRLLVVHLALRTNFLVLGRELLRSLVEEVGLLSVDRLLLSVLSVLWCWGGGGGRLRVADWRWGWFRLVVLPEGCGTWLCAAVVLRVLVDAGVLAVLAVVLLAVSQSVGGAVVQGRRGDHDAGSWKVISFVRILDSTMTSIQFRTLRA